ncbi:glycosyltransferase [Amorphus orientalis]|uniref:Dolichol-phosphate mannosyltransferase n=1 Tax=Amorphus orientalis TaxID=649198 RepID=A0AAE3VQZ7_9HYPH|nr:glycosyltransferase family 2 protein [Amorphus orientalis]MDQ0316580.1 dolichol-phosphate mannosyltransferase [Amorphus orientalis]
MKSFDPAPSSVGTASYGPLRPPEISVVLPTYNERDNILVAIERVAATLDGRPWEIIVVDDDSPDGTAELVNDLASRDGRVRCIHRIGRRGLSGACIEGMIAASAPIVAVMDSDLQHDETILPKMLAAIEDGEAEIVVGSRYVEGGAATAGLSPVRAAGSRLANGIARVLLGVRLNDPMSGFFMLRRSMVEKLEPKLSRQGFKILLDIVASAPRSTKVVEIPYGFRERVAGESKLDELVTIEFLALIVSKLLFNVVSVRFILFMAVGASGVVIHLATLRGAMAVPGVVFEMAQTIATVVAMTWNFFLNNWLTYRDRRLHGVAMLRGLVSFYLVCSLGVVANVGVASALHGADQVWWVAGTAGAFVGAVWNYAGSAALTWRVR